MKISELLKESSSGTLASHLLDLYNSGGLLNTRGEVASVETYRTVLSNVWLRIEGIVKGLREAV